MLNFFRGGGAGQVVIGVIVTLIIAVFIVQFRANSNSQTGSLKVECAARVYGYCVDKKDYTASLGLAAQYIEPKQQKKYKVPALVLEGLVERELLVREAERLGLGIGDREITDELEAGRVRVSLPADQAPRMSAMLGLCNLVPNPFFPNPREAMANAVCDEGSPFGVRMIPVTSSKTNRFDYEIYERTIRVRASRSPKEFRNMQRRELIAERMRELIRSQVVVSEAEVYATYERDNAKVVARTVAIHRDWFAKYLVEFNDKVLADYTKDHQAEVDERWETAKEGFKAECPLVSEVRMRFQPGSTDDDKVILRGKIDAALERLKKGERFERVAQSTSDGPTAVTGGALGCLEAEAYGPGGEELLAAIATLKAGEHTGVVETPLGFHIVRFEGRLAAADVEKVGKQYLARDLVVRFKADGEAKRFADDVIAALKLGQDAEAATKTLTREYLARASGKKDPKDEELIGLDATDRPRADVSAPFTRYGSPGGGVSPLENVAALAFALTKPGDVHPKPIETSDGVLVLALKEKLSVTRKDFEKVKQDLIRRRRIVKANEALIDYVESLRKQAEGKVERNAELLGDASKGADGTEGGEGESGEGQAPADAPQ